LITCQAKKKRADVHPLRLEIRLLYAVFAAASL
jgi:hypothetical protein